MRQINDQLIDAFFAYSLKFHCIHVKTRSDTQPEVEEDLAINHEVQAQIHTSFHPFMKLSQIFHNRYNFNK